MQTVAPERFRTVMGHFATGVTVVTAHSDRAPGTPDQVRGTGSHAEAVTGLLTP